MKQRKLGSSDTYVNEIGYGAMHLSIDREKRPSEEEAVSLLQALVDDLNVNFIDTADAYCVDDTETGHNERLIAKAIQGERRERVLIATKGGSVRPEGRWERNGRPEHLRSACEASLRALDTDRIDLYQLHAPDPEVPVSESIGTLADMQKEGKIRFIGTSNLSLVQLQEAMGEAEIISLQNKYSAMNRREQDEIIDFCEQNSITYIPWNPVGGRGDAPEIGKLYSALGNLADKYETSPHTIALAWLLHRSPAILPIPGTRKREHAATNTGASDIQLTPEDLESLNSIGQ